MGKENSAITVKEFVAKLAAGGGLHPSPADCVEYGMQQGWLESRDAAIKEQVLLRKHAARIIHNFLRLELKEPDEVDGSPAYVLQDLFDCRVCAGHIIQVYVKGIMDSVALPDGQMIFATDEAVSRKDAEDFVIKVFQAAHRTVRNEVASQSKTVREPVELSTEQVAQLLQTDKKILLVDVRTEREYEENHMENAKNVPLLSIIKNPFLFSDYRDNMILLYCTEGYQSKAAAQCLLETGYFAVAYFSWNL